MNPVCDYIDWVDWWLCGGKWTAGAKRWRYSSAFCIYPIKQGE